VVDVANLRTGRDAPSWLVCPPAVMPQALSLRLRPPGTGRSSAPRRSGASRARWS